MSRSTRYFAKKVLPISLAAAAGSYVYLLITKPKTKV